MYNPTNINSITRHDDVTVHFPTSHIVETAAAHLSSTTRKNFVTKLMKPDNQQAMANGEKTWKDLITSVATQTPVCDVMSLDLVYCDRGSCRTWM